MSPSISVVIPTYNRGAAVAKTVDSALNQDLAPEEIELVIVDDGSTDDTYAILQRLYGDHPHVRLFHQPNGGVARARNFGLEKARGEFIAYLDHDDLWLPQKLRLQAEKMRADDRVGFVHCDWLAVDENGDAMPFNCQYTQQKWWHPKEGDASSWIWHSTPLFTMGNPVPSMTFPLLRTQVVRDVGGFDPATVPSDDWDLWIRLAQNTAFAYVPQVLAHYVYHANQQHSNFTPAVYSQMRVSNKYSVNFFRNPFLYFKKKDMDSFFQESIEYMKAKESLFKGRYIAAIGRWIKAVCVRPYTLISKRWIYLLLRLITFNTARY